MKPCDDFQGGKRYSMSDQFTPHHYSYHGPLGEVSHSGRYYFAWKEGFLIGTYKTFEEAMESLVWRERLKTRLGLVGPF
jgi:hypothetical protein